MRHSVYIGGQKGGSTKTTTSHLIRLGAIQHRQPAAYVLTDKKPERLSWHLLYKHFGSDPARATDKGTVKNFRKDAVRELNKLKICWPSLDLAMPNGFLEVRGCVPSFRRRLYRPSPKEVRRAASSGLR